MFSYGSMKAVLRSHQGYTREVVIHPPPPEYITMAVSDSGSQIWNPNDLMVGEKAIFKNVRFLKTQELKKGETWLYVQEGDPKVEAAKMDDLYKALQPKLLEKIQEAMTQTSPFYEYMKNKEAPSPPALPQVVLGMMKELTLMTDNEILAICEKHKKDFQYDAYIENEMAALGYKTPPKSGEDPYAYLTRLMEQVKQGAHLKQLETLQQSLAQYEAMKKEYEQQKIQQQKYYESLQQQQVFSTQTNVPYGYGGYQPLLGDSISQMTSQLPPKIEKPVEEKKPKLPEPIEPRKRLMKRA